MTWTIFMFAMREACPIASMCNSPTAACATCRPLPASMCLEDSVSALLVDLDNDGDQDLVLATDPLIQFAENDGTGKFTFRSGTTMPTPTPIRCAAADYDQDGDVDIYVCGYNARKQDSVNRGLPFPLPYHDANNGGQNYLLRNEGGFRFQDVTRQTGLDQNNTRFSLAAAWEDYDDDGDQDLYVANDFGRNCLYRNDGGQFLGRRGRGGCRRPRVGNVGGLGRLRP